MPRGYPRIIYNMFALSCFAIFQYDKSLWPRHRVGAGPKRRLFVRSCEVSTPRDLSFKLSYRFEIWQAHRQQCCRSSGQIWKRSDNSKYKSRGLWIKCYFVPLDLHFLSIFLIAGNKKKNAVNAIFLSHEFMISVLEHPLGWVKLDESTARGHLNLPLWLSVTSLMT